MGRLWHRPYEKCAELHGALRLRGDRRRSERSVRSGAGVALRGVKTEGPMAPEIPLETSGRRNTCSTARCSSELSEIRAKRGAGEGAEEAAGERRVKRGS